MSQHSTKFVTAEFLDSAMWQFDHGLGIFLIQALLEMDSAPSHDQLVRALQRLEARIPLLGFRLSRAFWRDRWIPVESLDWNDYVEVIELPEEGDFDEVSWSAFKTRAYDRIDIAQQPPIRLLLFRRQGAQALLVAQIHHSVADGNGALQLMRMLGEEFRASPDSPMPTAVPMDRGFLQLFRAFRLSDWPRILLETFKQALYPLQFLVMKPLRDSARKTSGEATGSLARFTVSGDDYTRMLDRAHDLGLTINDYIATALAGLAAELNAAKPDPSRYVTVAFTVDFRRLLRDNAPRITNLAGISILIMPAKTAQNFERAAAAARSNIGELKRKFPGVGYVLAPMILAVAVPSRLVRVVVKNWMDFMKGMTARGMIMTNIGSMNTYVETFGDTLKTASIIAPFPEISFPVITVSAHRNSLNFYLGRLTRDDLDIDLCDILADRLRFYLLEWPFETL